MVSKAFTKEDDDAGFSPPKSESVRPSKTPRTAVGTRLIRAEIARLNALGMDARANDRARTLETLLAGGVIAKAVAKDVVGLGAEVKLQDAHGAIRRVVLVTPEEVGHVPNGASIGSVIARALVGAKVGDTIEVEDHREKTSEIELTVKQICWPD